MRKRIAVLAAQLEEHKQKQFITSFLKEAYDLDYDVCIFSMYQKFQETELRNIGDSNIYELVPYDMFDAILFMPDTILVPGVSERLLERMHREFHKPVLVVELDNPYFPSVKIDHYVPMRKLVDHLIEVHGYEDIGFLGGKQGHPHSVQRYDAFVDSMNAHNLPIRKECVFHGNYWYDSGKRAAMRLLSLAKRPRALVCANDCMAIGAAACLSEHGIRIPEDMAVVGYESIDEGKQSPLPLTSVEIPADKCGSHSMQWLHCAIEGKKTPEMDKDAPLFIGGSCGCTSYTVSAPKHLRDEWGTVHSDQSYYSDFNHITEDLLEQTDFSGFYQTVLAYTYQIRPFRSFHLCLNENYRQVETFIGEQAIRKGYADKMYRVIHCVDKVDSPKNRVSQDDSFETRILLPELAQETETPVVYVFNPLYFNDRCFGYSAISYSQLNFRYDEVFRIWMKSIMQGMESCYRQLVLQQLIEKMKAAQIRDPLTGLYNYQGFLQKGIIMYEGCRKKQIPLEVLALDIKDVKEINSVYGRDIGDRAISLMARTLQENITDKELTCRMCNDEFLVLLRRKPDENRAQNLIRLLGERLSGVSLLEDEKLEIQFNSSTRTSDYEADSSLEYLINSAIVKKNRMKLAKYRQAFSSSDDLSSEDIERNELVEKVLDKNLLTYNFQPLVRTRDGSIFGHEVLMRARDNADLGASGILAGAASLGRLYDVEKATFTNVLALMEQYGDQIGSRKIFINSLPAHQLKDEDMRVLEDSLYRFANNIVIEITEESEMSEEQFAAMEEHHKRIHFEVALDDYGSGYSNINNLLRYMPNYVKIDQMLIDEIEKNPHKQHFVRSIVEFAHNNKIKVLAEGVKTAAELRAVINLEVDLVQGFYISEPQPEPVIFLRKGIADEIMKYQQQRAEWAIDFTQI